MERYQADKSPPAAPPELPATRTRSTGDVPGRQTALSILESLSQGKISVEEAETLLAGLERA